jgi:hypothetical protein
MGLTVLNLPQRRGWGETRRADSWWARPAVIATLLLAFVVYATWAAFQNAHYTFGPYLSPFYSPEIFGDSPHAWFGPKPAAWPAWLPFSPALLILGIPAGFRLTCYYYRGAYYKAIWQDPPACAVGEPRDVYLGERSFPLLLQNFHRYLFSVSVVFLFFLVHDVWKALWFADPATGGNRFGIGVGTLVLAVNVSLLGAYTFGCHSLRHLIGGRRDRLSAAAFGGALYRCVGCFTRQHMVLAWCSLLWVAFSDVYVRLCSMGIWSDWRIL